jgi:anaerobic magnesium-protoporphyrin IX monomethyl ester cyclase
MERGVTVEQVQNAVRECKSPGIQTGIFLMWGYEGEEPEDIEATVEHVKRSKPDIFLTTVAYPIKGTPYFDEVAPRVLPLRSWEEGSDRDFRLRGRHSRRFYQFADQLLRSQVELARAQGAEGLVENLTLAAELKGRVQRAREGMREAFSEVEA